MEVFVQLVVGQRRWMQVNWRLRYGKIGGANSLCTHLILFEVTHLVRRVVSRTMTRRQANPHHHHHGAVLRTKSVLGQGLWSTTCIWDITLQQLQWISKCLKRFNLQQHCCVSCVSCMYMCGVWVPQPCVSSWQGSDWLSCFCTDQSLEQGCPKAKSPTFATTPKFLRHFYAFHSAPRPAHIRVSYTLRFWRRLSLRVQSCRDMPKRCWINMSDKSALLIFHSTTCCSGSCHNCLSPVT